MSVLQTPRLSLRGTQACQACHLQVFTGNTRDCKRVSRVRAGKDDVPDVMTDESGNTATDAIDDTLVDRVNELRGIDGYLRKGSSNFGGALHKRAIVLAGSNFSRKCGASTVPANRHPALPPLHVMQVPAFAMHIHILLSFIRPARACVLFCC